MCGRARCSASREQLEQFVGSHFGDSNCHVDSSISTHYVPSYNISPGKYLPVIIRNRKDQNGGHSDDYVELLACKWGLVPNFTSKTAEKVDHFKMFNCRSEEMQNKPSFKNLLSRNRCIVVTEGFYEWKHQHFGDKQPYYVYFPVEGSNMGNPNTDVSIMPMAGLFDCWVDTNNKKLYTCTILTTSSGKDMSWLHDRMPVILGSQEDMARWINAGKTSVSKDILQPYHGTAPLQYHKVSPKVGKISFQGKSCCAEFEKSQKSIMSLFHVKKEEEEKEAVESSSVENTVSKHSIVKREHWIENEGKKQKKPKTC